MADANTLGILMEEFTEEEIFGRLPDPGEDYAELDVILSDDQVLATFKQHYDDMIKRFEADQRERFLGNIHHSVISEWHEKGPAAIAHLKGRATNEEDAVLQLEADVTGETIDDLAAVIAPRYQAYLTVGPKITGLRRKISHEVNAATSPEMVVAIYNAARQKAQVEADQIAQALGMS